MGIGDGEMAQPIECLSCKYKDLSSDPWCSCEKPGILVRVSIAVMKHPDKSNVGRKGFVSFTVLAYSWSLREVRAGTQAGQDPGSRS